MKSIFRVIIPITVMSLFGIMLIGFAAEYVYAIPESDHKAVYDSAEHVIIGKIVSAKVMAVTGTSEYSSNKIVYEIQVEKSFKKQPEKKILMAWSLFNENPDLLENPLYEVGDRVFLYLQDPNEIKLYQIRLSESSVLESTNSICETGTYYNRGICAKKETGASLVANIDPYEKQFQPSFQFSRTMIIDYDDYGVLRDSMIGKDIQVYFSGNSSNPQVADMMQKINQNLEDLQSPSRVTELEIVFDGRLKGYPVTAIMEHTVTLTPTITGHIINKPYSEEPAIVDASWRGISILEPVKVVTTAGNYTLDINSSLSLIEQIHPVLYDIIDTSPAKNGLSIPIMNSSYLYDIPLVGWEYIFAPWSNENRRASIVPAGWDGWNVSAFKIGDFSLRDGGQTEIFETEIVFDKTYPVRIIENHDRGFIKTKGFASVEFVDGNEVLSITSKQPTTSPIEGNDDPTGITFLIIGIIVSLLVVISYYLSRVRK